MITLMDSLYQGLHIYGLSKGSNSSNISNPSMVTMKEMPTTIIPLGKKCEFLIMLCVCHFSSGGVYRVEIGQHMWMYCI